MLIVAGWPIPPDFIYVSLNETFFSFLLSFSPTSDALLLVAETGDAICVSLYITMSTDGKEVDERQWSHVNESWIDKHEAWALLSQLEQPTIKPSAGLEQMTHDLLRGWTGEEPSETEWLFVVVGGGEVRASDRLFWLLGLWTSLSLLSTVVVRCDVGVVCALDGGDSSLKDRVAFSLCKSSSCDCNRRISIA